MRCQNGDALAARCGACDDAHVHPDPHDELAAAIAAERAAWSHIKDKLPGAPGFDALLWATWQKAVQRCRAARQAVDGGAASQRPAGDAGPGRSG
jgi:hypothetical protein